MDRKKEIREYAIDRLEELKGYSGVYGGDLHCELFNTDYYIIGNYKAKEWLGEDVFEAIETIRDYEESNFGEVSTDFSQSERVVNMYVYILGEEILSESETLQNAYNRILTDEDIDNIIEELKE